MCWTWDSEEIKKREVARPAGFEPATIRLEGGCSIQLSYGRSIKHLPKHQDELFIAIMAIKPPSGCLSAVQVLL